MLRCRAPRCLATSHTVPAPPFLPFLTPGPPALSGGKPNAQDIGELVFRQGVESASRHEGTSFFRFRTRFSFLGFCDASGGRLTRGTSLCSPIKSKHCCVRSLSSTDSLNGEAAQRKRENDRQGEVRNWASTNFSLGQFKLNSISSLCACAVHDICRYWCHNVTLPI